MCHKWICVIIKLSLEIKRKVWFFKFDQCLENRNWWITSGFSDTFNCCFPENVFSHAMQLFKCGVESNNVRRGLVIYSDVMFFNITRRKISNFSEGQFY